MTKLFAIASAALLASTAASFAGDPAAGEKDFKKCKACHSIASADETIVKGGKTGPNLYGVVGRPAGSYEGFKYSDGMISMGESGLVWDEALITEYLLDPTKFIDAHGGSGRSKMTFKLKDGENVAAYLASVAPAPEAMGESMGEDMGENAGEEAGEGTEAASE